MKNANWEEEGDRDKRKEGTREGKGGKKEGQKYVLYISEKNIKYKALSIFNNMKYNSINYHQWTKDILMCNF